jgi:hypothetical protein
MLLGGLFAAPFAALLCKKTGQNADDHCWLLDYLYPRLQRLHQPELSPPRKQCNSAPAAP